MFLADFERHADDAAFEQRKDGVGVCALALQQKSGFRQDRFAGAAGGDAVTALGPMLSARRPR